MKPEFKNQEINFEYETKKYIWIDYDDSCPNMTADNYMNYPINVEFHLQNWKNRDAEFYFFFALFHNDAEVKSAMEICLINYILDRYIYEYNEIKKYRISVNESVNTIWELFGKYCWWEVIFPIKIEMYYNKILFDLSDTGKSYLRFTNPDIYNLFYGDKKK